MQFDFNKALEDGFSKEEIINAFSTSVDTDINWQEVDKKYLKQGRSDEFFELLKNPNNYTIYGAKQEPEVTEQEQASLNLQTPLNANAFNAKDNLEQTQESQAAQSQTSLDSLEQAPQELSKLEHLKLAFGGETQAQTQQRKEREQQANTQIKNALKSGISFSDLSEDLKTQALLQGKSEISYTKDLKRDELMEKDEKGEFKVKALNDEQKALIKEDLGFFNSVFTSEDDELKEWREKQEIQAQDLKTQENLTALQNSLNAFERYHKSGSISALFSSSEEQKKLGLEKLEKLEGFAKDLGFDGVGVNKEGDYFVYKGSKALWVNDGFFDNFEQVLLNNQYAITGSVLGGIAGANAAKAGKTIGKSVGSRFGLGGEIVGGIVGGAIGAGVGGILDATHTQLKNKEEINAKFLQNALRTGNEEAMFDLAAGSVGTYVLANGKKILSAPLKATKALGENLILTGTLKNALGDQNLTAAKDLIDANINPATQQDLKEFAKAYGGNLKMQEEVLGLTQAKEALSKKYGEDSVFTKTASVLEKLALEHNTQNAQKELLELIRADSSGQALGMLYQVAKDSPKANDNLKTLLNKTTQQFNKELESLNLNPNTLKEIYKDLEKGTKESYNIATNKVLIDLYKDEKIVLDSSAYQRLRQDLENNAELETSALSFLKFVENSVFNPKGVGLEQLINARKTLNGFIKDTRDSNTKSHLKNIVESHLQQTIQKGVQTLLETNPEFYQQALNLYNTSLSDYATMKQTLKNLKKLGFLDEAKSNEVLTDKFIKYIQGDGGLYSKDNFASLTQGLSEQNKQAIELNVLNRIYQRNLLKDKEIEVFASKNFLREITKVKEVFQSKGAREFIELTEGFNKLFGNDAEIALKMGYATPKVEGSSIATSIEGAVQQKMIKGIFGILMRNLPHKSIVVKTLGLDENVQAQALRFHLKKALENTKDINSFKLHLTQNAQKQNYNSATLQALKEIISELDALKADVLREVERGENALFEVKPQEAKELQVHFNFKGNKPLVREIRENEISHALKSHGDEVKELQRGNIAITRSDIDENYPKITQEYDEKFFTDKGVIYVKQVNGYHIAIEEALIGQDKLIFKSLWKTKGNYNREVLLRNAKASPYPQNADEAVKSKSISNPSLEQGNPLQSHLNNTKNLTTKDRIKQARELGLSPKEAVEFIKNPPKIRENTTPQTREILEAEILEAQEIPYLHKELLKWIQKRAKLITPNQEARVQTRDLIAFANEKNLSTKEKIKLLKNTPRNLPIQIKAESKTKEAEVKSDILDKTQPLKTMRAETKEILAPIKNKDIQHKSGIIARVSSVGISKMTSDKAIQKSVDNGFSKQQHLKAVQNIETLFKNSEFSHSETPKNQSKDIVAVHRYINTESLKDQNAQALITLKESFQNGNRIYSLELAELIRPTSLSRSPELKRAVDFHQDAVGATKTTPLFENPNAIIPQSTKDRIKQARELGLSPKEAVEFIKNPPKIRENTTPQTREILEAEILEAQEIPYLHKELLKWIQKRAKLITPNQEARVQTRDLIAFANEKNLSTKEKIKLLKNTPRNLPIQIKAESKTKEAEVKINFTAPIKQVKTQLIEALKPIFNKPLKSSDGIEAYMSLKSLSKMTSNKAIQKSLDNGFSREQHLQAVLDIKRLFENAKLQATEPHKSGEKNAIIHRLNSELENGNALITTKESLDVNKNRIYSVELELIPRFNDSSTPLNTKASGGGLNSQKGHQEQTIKAEPSIAKTDGEIIPQEKELLTLEDTQKIIPKIINPFEDTYNHYILEDRLITKEELENLSKDSKDLLGYFEKVYKDINANDKVKQYIKDNFTDSNKGFEYLRRINNRIYEDIIRDYLTNKINHFYYGKQLDYGEGIIKEYNEYIAQNLKDIKREREIFADLEKINQSIKQTIPQTTQEIIKQAKASGKSVKETKELIQKNKELQATQIQEVKELLNKIKKEARANSISRLPRYNRGGMSAQTKEERQARYHSNLRYALERNKIDRLYSQLESITEDKTLKGKAQKEAKDKIYLQMHEAIKKADEEVKESAHRFWRQLKQEELQEAEAWIEKNKGASSDYVQESRIRQIDKELENAIKQKASTEQINALHREKGKLTYAKNGDLGRIDIKLSRFHFPNYHISLEFLQKVAKENHYRDGKEWVEPLNILRKEIEARVGINPIKDFGTNYAEHYHSGESAIQKLLAEKQGQVAGAFYREELGDIDLVWGNKDFGLEHIISKHGDEFKDIAKELDEIIQKGEVVKTHNGYNITLGDYKVGLNIGWNENGVKIGENKWVVTAFDNSKLQSEKQGSNSASLTKGETLPLNSSEIIPQTQISNIKKQLVELKKSKSAYQKVLKDLERNMKDLELEERRYLRGEERIKAFERKRLIQSSIDEHTQGLNAVLKKMIELHKQLPENVRYTKEVLDDLTKIEAILKGNDYSLQQALRLSKITQRLQEKAIIESESFLNKVYNLDDFAKGAKSLQGTSYAYNTNDSIRKYFKIIAEMIDSIPAFKKISANQPETPPKVDSSEAPPSKINFTYTTGEAKGIAELRKDLKAALEPYKSTPITNKETGLQAVVTDTERNKISSKKAVDKSIANGFTRDEHFAAAQDLKNLFENATKAQSHNDYKQRENIAQVHRFVKDLYINDKQAQAKITLFEKIEGKNRIYTLELESLENPTPLSSSHAKAGAAVEAQVTRDVVRPNANIAKTDNKIIPQQTLESTMQKFNYDEKKAKDLLEWHKDSSPLTKDENGVPKVFYHGSRAKFDTFETQEYNFNIGHWFSNDETLAEGYVKEGQGTLFKTFLNIKKPFIVEKKLSKEKIAEINRIFNFTEQEQKEALKEVRRFKAAKKELELNGFEFLDFWRERIFLKHKESGKEFDIAHSCLTKKGIAEIIVGIKQLKELSEYNKERLKELQEFNALLPNSLTKMEKFTRDYYKDFFKNETELYLLAAMRIDYWADNPRFNAPYGYPTRTKNLTPFYKKAGYDGILFNDREIVAFDSNQIKHTENRGIESEQGQKYFNESSPNIFHSNPHAGAGLLGGSAAGIEQDEEGNYSFNAEKFVLGLLGGAAASKAVSQGFKILKQNPQLKEAAVKELANTLAQGFYKAREKYPSLSLLEPRYIVQNEKGRIAQARSMLNKAQQETLRAEQEALEKVLNESAHKAEILKDLDKADEILAVLLKGYQKKGKGKGAEHIRLEHTLEPTQEGYLTRNELLDMGVKMREFIQKHGEPFVETNAKGEKARIYEWENDKGVRFRIVTKTKEGNIAPLPLVDEIITFYSDRNLKEKMKFKNPALNESKKAIDTIKMQEAKKDKDFFRLF